jgi:hypothetical protein
LLPEDDEDVLLEDDDFPEYPLPELVDFEVELFPLDLTVDLTDERPFVEPGVPERVAERYRDLDELNVFLVAPERVCERPELLLLVLRESSLR